ncbi:MULTISPECIES: hypothetical protein [unclassified Spirosoma]|uniref:hypothetical protein n=1 Tax=unclassified Spirosoma TaxID=2621999 RepID=UPI0009651A7E|nr:MULTISPECIES: hypothetical protein [unclassified Spirosoma]MBN8824166.1 hypothetical protein [Spirosoma sp.]OJW78905.1 MAG: hypothetical protein BGO59_10570 [Spirosoma sp. 48-14]
MDQRIGFNDLERAPYNEHIRSLALEWVLAELPAQRLTYSDYLTNIRILLLTTQDVDRTSQIVKAVLAQAAQLHKPSEWVEQELKFEGMVEGADRVDFLRFELQQAGTPDDALLDQYNERMTRFRP